MQIIQAQQTHINALCELEHQIFDANSFPLSRRNFLYHLKKGNIFAAFEGDELLGYILIFGYAKSIRIYSLATSHAARGKGIGLALMGHVKNMACEKGKRSLTLEVKQSNSHAIEFYKKFGFKVVKSLQEYYPTEDGYKMELRLETK